MEIPKKLLKLKEKLEFENLTENERKNLMKEYTRQIRLLFNQVLRPEERATLLKRLEIKDISIKDEDGNELPYKEKKKEYMMLRYIQGRVPELISEISQLLKFKDNRIYSPKNEEEMIDLRISEKMNDLAIELRLTREFWDWNVIETRIHNAWGEERKSQFFENNQGLIMLSRKQALYGELIRACILIGGFIGILAFLFFLSLI